MASAEDRERVEDRRLVILRKARRDPGHRLLIGKRARCVVELARIAVEDADRVDVSALALRPREDYCATCSGSWLLKKAPPTGPWTKTPRRGWALTSRRRWLTPRISRTYRGRTRGGDGYRTPAVVRLS